MKIRKLTIVLLVILALTTTVWARTAVQIDDLGLITGPATFQRLTTLADIVTAAAGADITVLINAPITAVTQTVPITLKLEFTSAGLITRGAGQVITFAGGPAQLKAPITQQIFAGAGTTVYTLGGVVSPNRELENTTEGITDMTAAIAATIVSLPSGTVSFVDGQIYLTSADIPGKTGVNLNGNGATLTFTTTWAVRGTFFLLDNVDDVTIRDFIFDGQGVWTAVPFPYPYGAGNRVGFTNDQIGISNVAGPSNNLVIKNNTFTGLGRAGIRLTGGGTTLKVINNDFYNLGQAGIYEYYYVDVVITGNTISGIEGNMAATVATSAFADGIYIYDSQRGTISNNIISDCKRIGIVLEGVADAVYNTGFTISNNSIYNMNTCRGGEYNAAIWLEREEVDYTTIISGNSLDNVGAVACASASNGIRANRVTITGNNIRGFGIGIVGRGFAAIGNTLFLNTNGIRTSYDGESNDEAIEIIGNNIYNNTDAGIAITEGQFADGNTITIRSNVIRDNGTASTADYYNSGVLVVGFWVGQTVWIVDNTFISTADEVDTEGQLYGIVLRDVVGDDSTWTSRYIVGNQFSFAGTFATAYPASLGAGITPTSLGYDNLGGPVSYELMPGDPQNNQNTKAMTHYVAAQGVNFHSGKPIQIGFDVAGPNDAFGIYRKGDFVLNNDVDAGEWFGWVCVTAGDPCGSWRGFGVIE